VRARWRARVPVVVVHCVGPRSNDGRFTVKKLLVLLAAVAGGLFFARKRRNARAESDLWHEATSAPDLR
jgi:hypothetical protein